MLKKSMILFVIMTSLVFGEIIDEANLIEDKNQANLEKRLKYLENTKGLRYIIETQKDEKDFKSFENSEKTIKINILKNEKNVNVRLEFSKDSLKLGYSDEIDGVLERVEPLIKSENYIDLLYELTGEITDINQISQEVIEESSPDKKEEVSYLKWILFAIGIFLVYRILNIIKNKNKIVKCDQCNLKMKLMAEYERDNLLYKDYKCTMCGKEITKYTRG